MSSSVLAGVTAQPSARPHLCRSSAVLSPFRAPVRSANYGASLRCQAADEDGTEAPSTPSTPSTPPPTPTSAPPKPEVTEEFKRKEKEDQGLANITGGISVVLGVAYIVLVTILNSRGGEMLPPPPEAFLP